jgi:osmotically-inducible protein OsmY
MMNRHYRNGWLSRAAAAAALLAVFMLEGCVEAVILGGAATGAFVAADRRQPEIVAGDERVGLTALSRVRNRFGDKVHFNVTSYNYNVLLTGEVPDAQTKAEIEKIVMQIAQVKGVVNELQVAGRSTLGARGNDTYLTGRVKAAFVAENKFAANHVKVVTEAGVVYLLGLVTRKEADDATAIARSISGVRKVVRVFEYLTQAPK